MVALHMQFGNVLYPDISYEINGILFNIFKELGPGYREKHIQRAVVEGLRRAGFRVQEQVMVVMKYNEKVIGRYFLDCVINDIIVLELKVSERFYKRDYDQVKYYLFQSGLQLGLLARFGRNGVKVERVLRPVKLS